MRRLPCLLCAETFLNADTVITHYQRDHSLPAASTEAVYGSICPACGETFERLAQHSSRSHGKTLALLFADTWRTGDRRGVVEARVRFMLDRMLTDMEQAVEALSTSGVPT